MSRSCFSSVDASSSVAGAEHSHTEPVQPDGNTPSSTAAATLGETPSPAPAQIGSKSTEESQNNDAHGHESEKPPQAEKQPRPIDELFEAIQKADVEAMSQILEHHPDLINKQNNPYEEENRMTPQELLEANQLGSLMTQDVLRYQREIWIEVDYYGGQCPLHVACLFGQTGPVKLLLEQRNIDMNSRNWSEETPLGIACRAAHISIAKLLLSESQSLQGSQKIQVALEDDVGNTPIHYLAGSGIYPMWSENKKPAANDLRDVVQLMLKAAEHDSSISLEEFGRLCMEVAASQESTSLLQKLLTIVPELQDFPDDDGWTALHFGAAAGHKSVVDMLLEKGADCTIVTTRPSQRDAVGIALEFGHFDIAVQIFGHTSSNISAPKDGRSETWDQEDLTAWTWQRKLNREDSDGKPNVKEIAVSRLTSSLDGKRKQQQKKLPPGEIFWYHLPANHWQWVQNLCERSPKFKDILRSLEQTFASSGRSPPFCEHRFERMGNTPDSDDVLGNVAIMPLIDIDLLAGFEKTEEKLLNSTHWSKMMQLYEKENKTLHRPRTLDHYFNQDLPQKRLKDLNNDQVFTRYLHSRKQEQHSPQSQKSTEAARSTGTSAAQVTARPENLRTINNASQTIAQSTGFHEGGMIEAQPQSDHPMQQASIPDGGDKAKDQSTEAEAENRDRILVVSQLWLVRIENLLITSFPQCWDSSNQKQQFPQKLRSLFKTASAAELSAEKLFHSMVRISMQYQTSIQIGKETLTYLKVFNKEVLRISEEVDDCYKTFRHNVKRSKVAFRELSNRATECLIDINDVVHEIEIIIEVLDHRSSVWEKMHGIPPRGNENSENHKDCPVADNKCDPYEIRDSSYGDADKVHKDAQNVQKKIKDLMDLLYGQAGTETAIKSSAQASYLAIFTVLTVVFSPLSFVMSLLALQIESFTPGQWTKQQVAQSCGYSILATGLPCLVIWMYLLWKNHPNMYRVIKKAATKWIYRGRTIEEKR